ncbi:DUF4013 domain-containing protein [Natrarchaeobius oligotrophus]|nr:DUF4013 domain-containing protein [Natrarchaeobius chitinivorans]
MIIGSVLGLLSFLLIPAFFVAGYLVRVLETTVDGADEPPEFEEWGDLFVKGLVATVISIVYSFVPFVIYMVVVFTLVGAGGVIGGDGGGVLAGLGFVTMLTFIPLMLVIYYVVPAALTNYAHTGSINGAFDFGVIKSVVLSFEYLLAVLLPIVIAVIAWVVMALLTMTIVGIVLVPVVYFYSYVAICRMFGLAFAKTSPTTRSDSTGAAQPI